MKNKFSSQTLLRYVRTCVTSNLLIQSANRKKMKRTFPLIRSFGSHPEVKAKICVVGSGPAGFYAAQHLAKKLKSPEIDLLERFPVPYGLVRYGVAPDHADLKKVINTFNRTLEEHPNIRFLGNINLGQDVSLKQLREAYHVVLLTYGADSNRHLNIPGEDLPNIIPARKIVGWYNGLPQDAGVDLKLKTTNYVTIIGQGNVAIDVARILLKPIDTLKNTDITQHALDALSESQVKEVRIVGRRGPLQAAFTIKEFREMISLDGSCTVWRREDFQGVSEAVPKLERPRKRLTELMLESLNMSSTKKDAAKKFLPIFLRSPVEFTGKDAIETVRLSVNKLDGEKAIHTDTSETIATDLAVTSIGYKSVQADRDLPFDSDRGVAKHSNGKISDGLYAAGWLASGPSGVLLRTMNNAFGCAGSIVKDLESQSLEPKPGFDEIVKVLQKKNVQIVTWKDWLKIDEYETKDGLSRNKPREKIVNIKKMLEIAA